MPWGVHEHLSCDDMSLRAEPRSKHRRGGLSILISL
jgi:hypothetical protein